MLGNILRLTMSSECSEIHEKYLLALESKRMDEFSVCLWLVFSRSTKGIFTLKLYLRSYSHYYDTALLLLPLSIIHSMNTFVNLDYLSIYLFTYIHTFFLVSLCHSFICLYTIRTKSLYMKSN